VERGVDVPVLLVISPQGADAEGYRSLVEALAPG
jgi:hypothetical protein